MSKQFDNTKHDSLPCDVVVLPDDTLARESVKASEQIAADYEVFSVLDGRNMYAHASIYMAQLDLKSVERAKQLLERVAVECESMCFDAIGYGGSLGYTNVQYPAARFLALQKIVIDLIDPIRGDMRAEERKQMKNAEGSVLENLQKYGYPHVGELMKPHITFARLSSYVSPSAEALESILGDPSRFSGRFDRLGLFAMGKNGTCIRPLGEWRLS